MKNHHHHIRVVLFLITGLFSISQRGNAQTENSFILPANTLASDVSWRDSTYKFSEFLNGRITFTTGFSTEYDVKLNYSYYYGNFELIEKSGDTVQLKLSPGLKQVDIGGHTFYYDVQKGYIEMLYPSPVGLGVRTSFDLVNMQGVIVPRETLHRRTLASGFDREYIITKTFFFIDQHNKLREVNKTIAPKLFPEHSDEVNDYILSYRIDFSREEDLIQLLRYANQLNNSPKHEPAEFFSVKAGEDISKAAWRDSIYRLPEFQEARITYMNGSSVDSNFKVNYNFFSGEMDAIQNNGDTLKIEDASDIKIINIDGLVFLRDKDRGYLEILVNSPISLAVKNVLIALKTTRHRKT